MTEYAPIQVDRIYPDKPSLRIALVTETYPPDINGVAHTVSKIVEGLRARGHELMLVRPRNHSDHEAAVDSRYQEVLVRGAPIPMYKQLRMGLPAQGALQKLWLKQRPDLVHIATEGPLGWSASRAARKLKIPTSSDFRTNFHAYSQFYGFGWLKGAIVAYMRKFHNATHCTMVPTQGLMAELSKIGFDRLMVVPRGVDTENFSPAKRDEAMRQGWGATADTQVLLSVGRLAVEKNLDIVVRCFKSLQAKGLPVKLIIVGDGPLRQALERSVPEAIFAGTRTGQDLAKHYASADLFIFPSLTETFGNVTIEAMASGLAVVAYNHAAAGQLIEHLRNGMVLSPNQEEQLFEAAQKIVEDPVLRNNMRLAARQTAVDRDWSSVITRTESIFRSLIANEDPSAVLVSSKAQATVLPEPLR
jgi:glycosyltransferase involved in cell wall biosynthesis